MPLTYVRVVEALRCREWHVEVLELAREAFADPDSASMVNPVVQLARSGLCTGERQAALEAAIARLNGLAEDAPRDEVYAAWREAAAAHDAAFASLEGVAGGAVASSAPESRA